MDDRVLSLVEDVYAAALDPRRWQGVLDGIADLMVADHAHLFIADSKTLAPLFTAVGHPVSEELLAEYHEYYHRLDPRMEAGLRLPAGVLYLDHELCDPEAFERSEFYNDYYRRLGARWMTGGMFERGEEVTIGFAVVRTPRQGGFQKRDLVILSTLQPHLANAARVQCRLMHGERAAALGLETLDRISAGVVVLDARGRTVAVNRAARALFAAGDGLALGARGPEASHGASAGSLREALLGALRQARGESGGTPAAVPIVRPSGARPYEVLVTPLLAAGPGEGALRAGVLVLVSDPERASDPPECVLERLHGLTPAEARVAAALAAGHTLSEIAEAMGYSREAARWHLKQVFLKTGTHRQAELVRVLRNGPPALMDWEAFEDPG